MRKKKLELVLILIYLLFCFFFFIKNLKVVYWCHIHRTIENNKFWGNETTIAKLSFQIDSNAGQWG